MNLIGSTVFRNTLQSQEILNRPVFCARYSEQSLNITEHSEKSLNIAEHSLH